MAIATGVKEYRGFLMTRDPLHIGTGSYRLGRVDLPIMREPGTNLPKIPGTSLNGMARAYAALLAKGRRTECAGQGRLHCGKKECPVCYTFGTIPKGEGPAKRTGWAGTANIFDAHLLFFPVATMCGPVWITSPSALERADFANVPQPVTDTIVFTHPTWSNKPLNLGWLLLNTKPSERLAPPGAIQQREEWSAIGERIAVVDGSIFTQIVNSNLEIRTSVSINQDTGAAEDGGLFTYEALPRSTWLAFDLIVDDYLDAFPGNGSRAWTDPSQVVRDGVALAEYLGVGGMGTRGFGRVRLLCLEERER